MDQCKPVCIPVNLAKPVLLQMKHRHDGIHQSDPRSLRKRSSASDKSVGFKKGVAPKS